MSSKSIVAAHKLDVTDVASCTKADPGLAEELRNTEDIKDVYYYLQCGRFHDIMPLTRSKINHLLLNELSSTPKTNWVFYEKFQKWLDDPIKNKLVDRWLDSEEVNSKSTWIGTSIPLGHKTSVKALGKFIMLYKKNRGTTNLTIIENLFKNIKEDQLEEACELISKSTPAVSCLLLSKENLTDKYTLIGLKAMSKLSKQRSIDIKIDFDMLKHLGPKSRMDAIKQLIGMLDKWGSRKRELPFKVMPTREEVEFFLFPCSIKYNEEVVELVTYFSNLTKP